MKADAADEADEADEAGELLFFLHSRAPGRSLE
jgi:hypothetical protein